MRIPFFNLKIGGKSDLVHSWNNLERLTDLLKISQDNDKEIEKIILSTSIYYEFITKHNVQYKNGKVYLYGVEIQEIPEIAVVWKKERRRNGR